MALEDEMTMDEVTAPVVDEAVLAEKAAGFDLEAWVQGMTPVRRSVTIYGDMSGNADIGILEARIREARLAGADTKEIRALETNKRAVAKHVADSALDFVFEGRSADWIRRATKDAQEAGVEDAEILYRVMCGQIVEPAGVTPKLIGDIAAVDGGQFANLLAMWKQTNAEAGVDIPF